MGGEWLFTVVYLNHKTITQQNENTVPHSARKVNVVTMFRKFQQCVCFQFLQVCEK